jgi:hypothetical protein
MTDFNQKSVLLDTSYSKTQTEIDFLHKNVRFTTFENIDHNTKKANKESFDFYLNQKLPKITYEFVKNLYCENEGIPNIEISKDFIFPLEIYETNFERLDQLKNDSLLYFAEKTFLKWYHKNKSCSNYIFMSNENKKRLKKITNRFDKKYQTMVQNRMNWLMYRYGNENACSITLTLNPSNFSNSKLCMWETINILLNEFITQLRKWFRARGRDFPKYIRCIESMKGIKETCFVGRGNPHIHICLFGVKYIPKSVITGFWNYGFNFVNSTANNQKVRYPIHYVTKYITKTYTENDVDNTLNQSLVWFFNKHSFEHSSSLVYPLYSKGSGEWNFEYYVTMVPLTNDFEEMDFIFNVEENLYKIPPPITINHALHEGVIT